MIRQVLWVRLGAVVALIVPAAMIFAAAQTGGGKTGAAKAFEADPGLRAKLTTDTFKKLKEKSKKAQINGKTYYFVEGDRRLDEDQLLGYAQELEAQFQRYRLVKLGVIPATAPAGAPLMLHVVNGKKMRQEPGSTLTYCVQKQSFTPAEYTQVVGEMDKATKDWSRTCNIKFKHAADKDDTAPGATPPDGTSFTVRKVNDPNGPIASAFFPGDPAEDRHVLLFPDYFTTGFDKVGVLRHELGHMLGWRHEMIRSEAPMVCQGEPILEAIPVTAYDPQSVMHYFCGGAGNLQLTITLTDREGARLIYGPSTEPGAGLQQPAPPGPLDARDEKLRATFENVKN